MSHIWSITIKTRCNHIPLAYLVVWALAGMALAIEVHDQTTSASKEQLNTSLKQSGLLESSSHFGWNQITSVCTEHIVPEVAPCLHLPINAKKKKKKSGDGTVISEGTLITMALHCSSTPIQCLFKARKSICSHNWPVIFSSLWSLRRNTAIKTVAKKHSSWSPIPALRVT